MRILPLLPFLLICEPLLADQVVVFGEKDFYVVDASPAPAGPKEGDRIPFFDAAKADMARHSPLEKAMDLVNPPSWGKTVSAATHGRIQFHPSFAGGFLCHLTLDGLLPGHGYILTLNGNPAKAGNGLLVSSVPGNEQEKYYDFLIITSDPSGHYDADLGVFLKAGKYDVRCYVKDAGDFKIVLYRDFFEFEVK